MQIGSIRSVEFRRDAGINLLRALLYAALVFLPSGGVFASEANPDPRFGVVEAYQRPQAAQALGVGGDRLIIEWYRVQPLGPQHWLSVFKVPF